MSWHHVYTEKISYRTDRGGHWITSTVGLGSDSMDFAIDSTGRVWIAFFTLGVCCPDTSGRWVVHD